MRTSIFLPQTVEAVVPKEAEFETEEEPEVGTRKSVKRFRDPRRQFIITSDKKSNSYFLKKTITLAFKNEASLPPLVFLTTQRIFYAHINSTLF